MEKAIVFTYDKNAHFLEDESLEAILEIIKNLFKMRDEELKLEKI